MAFQFLPGFCGGVHFCSAVLGMPFVSAIGLSVIVWNNKKVLLMIILSFMIIGHVFLVTELYI